MNAARRMLVMVMVGVLIAAGIIGGVNALEHGKVIPSASNSFTITRSTTITSVSTTVSSLVQTGILAAQITDPPNPPNVPVGTTHVYVDYTDIEAHTISQNNSVWFTVARAGTVDLLSILNVGVTIGSATVTSGIYDQARFDITNATVTFGGVNYTASVPLNQITVRLANGGAVVRPTASAGFLNQLTPTVLALNSGGKPSFEIVAATQGVAIPQESWSGSLASAGSVIQNISNMSWWTGATPIGDNLVKIPGTSIYPTELLVILNNTGTTPVTISALNILVQGEKQPPPGANISTTTIVSTYTTVTTITEIITNTGNATGAAPGAPTPSSDISNMTVASFLILSNGSLIQPGPGGAPISPTQVGLAIKPGQVTVLLYTGYINTINSPYPPYSPQSIIGGQEYVVQLVTPFGSSVEFSVNASYAS